MSKDNELKTMKNVILENSELTEKELEKEISETKKQAKKELGTDAIDENGALHLIANKHQPKWILAVAVGNKMGSDVCSIILKHQIIIYSGCLHCKNIYCGPITALQ